MSSRTTVYLPDALKAALTREAHRRGCSEAQVIRDALTLTLGRPMPTPGIIDGEPMASEVGALRSGFGER